MSSSAFGIWLEAIRPKTLPLAILSIIVGSGLAFAKQQFSITILGLTILTALLLQILSNLANDYGDAIKGTDNLDRIGPKRAMQQGLVSAKDMKKALGFNILLTVIFGSTLLFYALKDSSTSALLSFFAFGLVAILAAIFYTIGNKPYGYQGLGDLSVLIFFGWLAVLGSYYLHTKEIDWLIALPATATGLLSVAVLNINNLRDFDNDKACNKLTLVVRIGVKNGKRYQQGLVLGAFSLMAIFTFFSQTQPQHWLFLLAIPIAIKHIKALLLAKNGQEIALMLADIVKLSIITNLLFVIPFLF